jgi:hypothetical protein
VKIHIAFCKPDTLDFEGALEGIQSVRSFLNAIVHRYFFPQILEVCHIFSKFIAVCMYVCMYDIVLHYGDEM